MKDYRTMSVDEVVHAVDGWAAADEASHHAKLLAHELRKLRIALEEARATIRRHEATIDVHASYSDDQQ